MLLFLVDNRRQLEEKIIPFFERYPLIGKARDYNLFTKIVFSLQRKDHSDINKFIKLVKAAFEMNQNGKQRRYNLSEVLKDLESKTTRSSETIRQTP